MTRLNTVLQEPGEQDSLFQQLSTVDWSFENRKPRGLDAVHPYPAKFVPELPGSILDALPRPNGVVLDPFCGSGTTLVEAQTRGFAAAGIDLNPIACLISRVKTSPLPDGLDSSVEKVLAAAQKERRDVPGSIPNIDHWFAKFIQHELASLTHAISTAAASHQDILRLALSSIVVRVSNQESDTRYAAIKKNLAPGAVFTAFKTTATRLIALLKSREPASATVEVVNNDTLALDWGRFGKLGAVITSPPYPNAYEYWLYHKYRMYWLGFDPLLVKDKEIGARAHFFKKNHHTAETFVEQMKVAFQLIAQHLDSNGYAAFVVGRSKIHGQIIDNALILENVARDFGFRTEYKVEREILSSRKSFNLSHANIKTETLLIFTP